MAITKTQVSELFVSIFGRASEGEGNTFWQTKDSTTAAADEMYTLDVVKEYFGVDDFVSEANVRTVVESIYLNSLGKAPEDDVDGINFWVNEVVVNGVSMGQMTDSLITAAKAPENAGVAQNTFLNKVSVSDYTADTLEEFTDFAQFQGYIANVDDTTASVNAAKADVDADVPAAPGEEGDTQYLTTTQDNLTGTADDDTFIADAGANLNGNIVNALQTGDRIDGGAGTDTLESTLLSDVTLSDGEVTAVRPTVNNVEKVFINALDSQNNWWTGTNHAGVNSLTRVNADSIDGSMDAIWSNGSEASLRVENVANDGDAEDILIGMRSTGNFGSLNQRQESDYEVYFEEVELTAGTNGEGGFFYDLLNQEAYDVSANSPVLDFPLSAVNFSISFSGATAEDFSLAIANSDMDSIANHTQLAALLNSKLNALAGTDSRLDDLVFEVKGTFTDGDGRTGIDRIQLTDNAPEAREITTGSISLDTTVGSGNLYWDQGTLEAVITDEPVTGTVILDDVGRGSDGGFLRVGSMSEDIGDTDHGSTGIEVYDIEVQRDSSVSGLYTTNNTLDTILITSGTGFDGDLEIGNTNTSTVSGETIFETDLDLVKATNFNGDLTIGTSAANGVVTNLKTLDAGIAGDVSFTGSITNPTDVDSVVDFNYMTGAGDDFIRVDIDGDAVDAVGESLAISASNGDNTVQVELDANVSQATMALLSNLDITTGSGKDTISNEGIGNFDISAGASSDFVHIKSVVETNSTVASLGHWEVSTDTGASTFVDRVLYSANLTVRFAGFEKTVKVATNTAGSFVANQLVINDAIMAAIDGNPELAKLLTYTKSTSSQQLEIDSTVEGLDELSITLKQPTLVASGATAGQVNFSSSDSSAMQAGLIATTANDSDATDTTAEVIALVNGLSDAAAGNLMATGVEGATLFAPSIVGGTADETTVVNFSTIDMGTGANDLLVLNSNDLSANTVLFSAEWNKVSIKNFFTDSAAGGTEGLHILDFTAWLNDQTDASTATPGDTQSAISVVTTDVAATAFSANTVVSTTFSVVSAIDGSASNTFANLSDAEVLTALRADATFGTAAATANLVGTSRDSILFIENNNNVGEYKVYNVDTTNVAATDSTGFTAVNLIGTIDFGASVDVSAVVFA